jgi:hypothetical protein
MRSFTGNRTVKKITLAIVLTTLPSVTLGSSVSAMQPGTQCLKSGSTKSANGFKFFCIKKNGKLVWSNGVLDPRVTKYLKSPEANETFNPVRAKIAFLVSKSEIPKRVVTPIIEWVATPEVSNERINSLITQHQELSDAYPDLYTWKGAALGLISSDPTKIRLRLESEGCTSGYIESVKVLEADPKRQGAGTSFCKGRFVAFFLDRNMSTTKWRYILGSEFGGAIQENSYKSSPNYLNGDKNWYGSTPNWYAEGSQTILSAIAEARAKQRWDFTLKDDDAFRGDWCISDTIEKYRCGGLIGAAAVELAVALYGWDAPLKLFKDLDSNISEAENFEKSFGDSLKLFSEWSSAYLIFQHSNKKLPRELINRLYQS